MMETRIAKLFKDGASQAVRLPEGFYFEGDEIYATRDDVTGDVVLSNRSGRPGVKNWSEFFALLHTVNVPDDFMVERELNVPSSKRGVFDDEAMSSVNKKQ